MLKVTQKKFSPSNNISKSKAKLIIPNLDFPLSLKAHNMVKKCSLYIEDVWTDIKKSGIYKSSHPEFHTVDAKTLDFVTVKPIYQDNKKLLYFEIESEKYVDRIIIDRQNPNHYTYEHSVLTPHGSATLKSFNSQRGRDFKTEEKVSQYIEKYFPEIVPKSYGLNVKKSFFTKREIL